MIKLGEIFPVEALAPIAGGAILWFIANYGFLAPDVIGPRLAQKYYEPACLAAVQDGRQAHAARRQTLVEQGRERVQRATEEFRRQAQGQTNAFFGMMLGNDRQGRAVMDRHGAALNNWAGGAMAPALQQFQQQQTRVVAAEIERHDQEARSGIIHPVPAQYCRCVVAEGFKDRIELATFTATLRVYTPDTIHRLKDGTMLHEAPACGKTPIV